MAALTIKVLDIVKYKDPVGILEAHPEYASPINLDAQYGIVRDAFLDVVYVEFFYGNKSLGVEARKVADLDRIGPMYDIIKKSLIPVPAPVIKEKIVREKPAKEDAAVKKEKPTKAVKDPVTKLTATQQPANAGSK